MLQNLGVLVFHLFGLYSSERKHSKDSLSPHFILHFLVISFISHNSPTVILCMRISSKMFQNFNHAFNPFDTPAVETFLFLQYSKKR